MRLKIDEVRIGRRLRSVNPIIVNALTKSIAKEGLRVPITVSLGIERRKGGSDIPVYLLIAGLQRLTACRRLGDAEIEAKVIDHDDLATRIAEIDANLSGEIGKTLTHLERSEHLLERRILYARLNPGSSRHGGDRRSFKFAKKCDDGFLTESENVTGRSRTSVQKMIRRADVIDGKVKAFLTVYRPDIADNSNELDRLVSLSVAAQLRVLTALERKTVKSVREALQQATA